VARAVHAARARRWREENAAAMDAYNRFIDAHGVPLAEFRKFWTPPTPQDLNGVNETIVS
jgi:antitoxin CcdA